MTPRKVSRLAEAVATDGYPDVVVGVLRGGMIPAVLIAHACGLRDVRAVQVTHTTADGANAEKTAVPIVSNAGSLGDLAGRDVLIVDDVAGSGQTILTAKELVESAGAARVRVLACALNQVNWLRATHSDPGDVLTYIGGRYRGWVVFPWETR